MRRLALTLLLAALAAPPGEAAMCAKGAYHAGCAAPRGVAVAHRPIAPTGPSHPVYARPHEVLVCTYRAMGERDRDLRSTDNN